MKKCTPRNIFVVLFLVFVFVAFPTPSSAQGQSVFGPKDYEIQKWHLLISFDQFGVDQPGQGVVLVSLNAPAANFTWGYVYLNGYLINLGDLLRSGASVLEKEVTLKSLNPLVVFLQGSPGASIRIEVRKKGLIPENRQPAANSQSVTTDEDTPVIMRLTASDADGDPLVYRVLAGPGWGVLRGTPPDLTYLPFENFHGTDSFTFNVNDGFLDSPPATVNITVNPLNDLPIANAGPDQGAYVGDTVMLNGTQSKDVDGDTLTFQWFFVSWPGEGSPALLDSDSAQPRFMTYFPGTYQVRLVVYDGTTESSSDTTVTVGYAPFSMKAYRIMAGDGQEGDHFGASVAVSGDQALAGAPSKGAGSVYVFAWDGSIWTEETVLSGGDGEAGDHFGTSVSISGNYALVGADGVDDRGEASGAAYMFEHHSPWAEAAKLTASDGEAGDHFGASVSISGDYDIVGAYGDDAGTGWDGSHFSEYTALDYNTWSYGRWTTYLGTFILAPDESWANGFRPNMIRMTHTSSNPIPYFYVTDISGTIRFGEAYNYVSGTPVELNCTSDIGRIYAGKGYFSITNIEYSSLKVDSGSAYVFRRDGSTWAEQAKLTAADETEGDQFGISVFIDGDYAIVGSHLDDDRGEDSGSAYIFKREGSTWAQHAKLTASDGSPGDRFGASVSVSGSYAIVGAPDKGESQSGFGAAYVFKREGLGWVEQVKLTASDAAPGDHFGASVSISHGYVAIGAPDKHKEEGGSGAVYVFRRNGKEWVEKTEITAGGPEMRFGAAVAMESEKVIIGVGGDESFPGSAYLQTIESYHTVTISAYPEILRLGESSTLEWTSVNDIYASIDNGIGAVPLNGSLEVTPSQTTTYTITTGSRFGVDSDYITIFVNQPPSIQVLEPDGTGDTIDNRLTIRWIDQDPDDNASISLFYDTDASGADGTLIVSGLREDPDEPSGDFYTWDASQLPGGAYYIYAVIDDGFNDPVVVYGSGAMLVDHGLYSGSRIGVSAAGYGASIGSSIATDRGYAIAGAPSDSSGEKSNNGSAYILRYSNGAWRECSKLFASDIESWDYFGTSVSISGEYAVVGAYGDDDHGSSSGAAYIFRRENSSWTELMKLAPNDLNFQSLFGWSVSIDGDYAAIGAPGAGSGAYYYSGAVYVFKRNGSSWDQMAKLIAADRSGYSQFGVSVCIKGEYVLIGASGDSYIAEGGGSAYVFKREGMVWTEQAKLVPNGVGAADGFGSSVSIDGDYAIVGAPHSDWYGKATAEPGSAYVFKREDTSWIEQAKLVAMNGTEDDYFGNSVSISGDYVIVGAEWAHERYDGHKTGSAYLFKRMGSFWQEVVELIPDPGSYYDMSGPWFGSAVAINGPDMIVGASADYPSGAVYAYSLIPLSVNASVDRILVGESATLSWKCPDATSVSIDNGIGSVPAQGSISVYPMVTTTYAITATSPLGSRTLSVTVIVDTISISINSPANGTTILRRDTRVQGTIRNPLGLEVGINVNGILAIVDGETFVANHVPLQEGENTIIAVATTSAEQMAIAQVTLHVVTEGDYVKLTADPESGLSPFETTLRVEASFNFNSSYLSHTGPGAVEVLSNPNPNEYTVAITSPGLYEFTVQVTDGQSNVYTDSVTILVMNKALLDGILRTKWNSMKSALIAGDNQKALRCFHSGSKSTYEEIFSALGTRLPGIASAMGEISPVYHMDKIAKYRIRKEEVVQGQTYNITHYIYFVRDSNGLWQIESF